VAAGRPAVHVFFKRSQTRPDASCFRQQHVTQQQILRQGGNVELHFGKAGLPWEETTKVAALQAAVKKLGK
jgi:hypothetical protein